jgi:hypothetical protein
MAAVLACGDGAVLSHHSAAVLLEVFPHCTRRRGIPVTSMQRKIDDLEGTVPPYLLRRVRRQSELKGIHLEGAEASDNAATSR